MARMPEYDLEKTQAPEDARDVLLREKKLRDMTLDHPPGGQPMRPMTNAEILAELFTYHPPTAESLPKFAAINQAAKNFAEVVLQTCPPSADRSDAIRKIREARMTANAAVALNGLSL